MKFRSILAMLPIFAAMAENKKAMNEVEPYIMRNTGYGHAAAFINQSDPWYIPRRGKFKGYMRDNRNWGRKRRK